jgi:hypothetical protein
MSHTPTSPHSLMVIVVLPPVSSSIQLTNILIILTFSRPTLAEICHYQKAEGLLVPKVLFQYLVYDVTQSVSHPVREFKF